MVPRSLRDRYIMFSWHSTPMLLLGMLLGLFGVSICIAAVPSQPAQAGQSVFLPLVVTPPGAEALPNLPFDVLATHTGEGTFFDTNGQGNCSFDATTDLMVAAMNEQDYATAFSCGAYVAIDGPAGSVTVRIVDRCPECAPGDIDLSRQAFQQIAPLSAGRVPISWRMVAGNVSGPIAYRFKEGSNQWWTAVQVLNHRYPIARLEYRNSAGEFVEVERMQYNYFVVSSGLGPGPYTFRVTDVFGRQLVDSGIPFELGRIIPGAAQFPPR